MTRVLVLNLYYPPHQGGYEASCADVVDRLAARGHEMAVLTSSVRSPGDVDPPGERDAPVPVWRDLTAYVDDGRLLSPPVHQRWRVERENQRALRRAIERHRPEVVSAWQVGGMSLGLLTTVTRLGLPITYSICDDWLSYSLELDAWNRLFRRLPAPVTRALGAVLRVPTTTPDLGRTGPFLFISDVTRDRARKYSPWSMDDTAIVHSGIDTKAFPPASPPAAGRRWGGRLLYAGRYDPRKGIETAIRALTHLDTETLEVNALGDPAERRRLEAVVDELGLRARVEFTTCPRAELAERYRAADLVVFPSEWEEPFGLVPLEAMASGTPVAGTGTGGSGRFLLDGVNCVRFRPGDPADLAAAVRRVAADAGLRSRLVRAGLRTAATFDVERLADDFEAWHAAAAERFAHGRPRERVLVLDAAEAPGA